MCSKSLKRGKREKGVERRIEGEQEDGERNERGIEEERERKREGEGVETSGRRSQRCGEREEREDEVRGWRGA